MMGLARDIVVYYYAQPEKSPHATLGCDTTAQHAAKPHLPAYGCSAFWPACFVQTVPQNGPFRETPLGTEFPQ